MYVEMAARGAVAVESKKVLPRTVLVDTTDSLGQRGLVRRQVLDVEIGFASFNDDLAVRPDVPEAVVEGMLGHV